MSSAHRLADFQRRFLAGEFGRFLPPTGLETEDEWKRRQEDELKKWIEGWKVLADISASIPPRPGPFGIPVKTPGAVLAGT